MDLNPLSLLKQATKDVPAVKYASGLVGIAAAVCIIGLLFTEATIEEVGFAFFFMIIAMTVLVIFAAVVKGASDSARIPAKVFLWTVCILVIIVMSAFVSALITGYPKQLAQTIFASKSVEATSGGSNFDPSPDELNSTKKELAVSTDDQADYGDDLLVPREIPAPTANQNNELIEAASKYDKIADEFEEKYGHRKFNKAGFINLLKMLDAEDKIDNENAAAIILALVQRETAGRFVPMKDFTSRATKERMYGHQTPYGQMLGNEIEGDGYLYEPRGYIKIVGKTQYKEYGEKIGVNLINHPEKMMEQRIAFKALMIFVSDTRGFRGRNLLDDIKWNSVDYRSAFTNLNGSSVGAAQIEEFTNNIIELFQKHRT